MHDLHDHLRAAGTLVVMAWMLILAAPFLDFMKPGDVQGDKRLKLVEKGAVGLVTLAAGHFNNEVRLPVVETIAPTQFPFRIAQSWHLYRDGPMNLNRMEVVVDDELWYRSQDPDHAWHRLRYTTRRLRPMVETTGTGRRPKNWEGLLRWTMQEVLIEKPDAKKVEILGTRHPFPEGKARIVARYVTQAPDWKPRRVK